jgi:hypothetical protein
MGFLSDDEQSLGKLRQVLLRLDHREPDWHVGIYRPVGADRYRTNGGIQ